MTLTEMRAWLVKRDIQLTRSLGQNFLHDGNQLRHIVEKAELSPSDKILEVADSGTWKLRHPVGPDALGFIQWRTAMTDEDWIDMNAGDDATFFAKLGGAS